MQPSLDVADAIADLPTMDRLQAFRDLVDASGRLEGISKTAALQLNAEVTTLLRERHLVPFAVMELV